MISALLLVIPVVAGGIISPIGYGPEVGAGIGFYPAGPGPIPVPSPYAGYPIAKPVYYTNQVNDGANFYGGNQGYSKYANDAMAKERVKDVHQIANRGGHGVSGGHTAAIGKGRNEGFYQNGMGADYNQESDGLHGGQKQYDVSSNDGYGGYGAAGHKKAHRTSGFHKSYHNVESGKDTKFVDEDHDLGQEAYGQAFDNEYDDKAYDAYGHGQRGGVHAHKLTHDEGEMGGARAHGIHNAAYDSHGQNHYYKDRDLAYRNAQALANANHNAKYGHSGLNEGVNGVHYAAPGYVY